MVAASNLLVYILLKSLIHFPNQVLFSKSNSSTFRTKVLPEPDVAVPTIAAAADAPKKVPIPISIPTRAVAVQKIFTST